LEACETPQMREACVRHSRAIEHQRLQIVGPLQVNQSGIDYSASAQDKGLQVWQIRDMLKKRPCKLWIVRQIDSLQARQISQVAQVIIDYGRVAEVEVPQLS
jgi:hypothetical protein